MVSRNQILETVRLQTGLHLYQTGQSKYWYVRILVPKTKNPMRSVFTSKDLLINKDDKLKLGRRVNGF